MSSRFKLVAVALLIVPISAPPARAQGMFESFRRGMEVGRRDAQDRQEVEEFERRAAERQAQIEMRQRAMAACVTARDSRRQSIDSWALAARDKALIEGVKLDPQVIVEYDAKHADADQEYARCISSIY